MSKLAATALAGAVMLVATIVVGLIPTDGPDGRDCGSVLGPGRHGSEVCQQAREDQLPLVLVLLAVAAVLLIGSLVVWWRRASDET